MSFQKAALSNLGGVEMHKGDFRAHLQFRDEEGKNTNIRGPPRATEREAYADLEAIRASGGLGNTRGESLREHLVDDSPGEDETSQKEQEHLTPIDATAKLLTFRPVISKPSDLKYLLECKADPNMPIPSGKITPLRNIMSFAPTSYVVRMRGFCGELGFP